MVVREAFASQWRTHDSVQICSDELLICSSQARAVSGHIRTKSVVARQWIGRGAQLADDLVRGLIRAALQDNNIRSREHHCSRTGRAGNAQFLLIVLVSIAALARIGNSAPQPAYGPKRQCADPNLSMGVNFDTGEFTHQQTDLVVPGIDLDFQITRTYRTHTSRYNTSYFGPGGLGYNLLISLPSGQGVLPARDAPFSSSGFGNQWSHNYDMRVAKSSQAARPNENLLLLDEEGRVHLWLDPVYTPPGGVLAPQAILTRDGDTAQLRYDRVSDVAEYVTPDHTVFRFHSLADPNSPIWGRLKSITSRRGFSIQLTYDVEGRIQSIVDTVGNTYWFGYAYDGATIDSPVNYLITSITQRKNDVSIRGINYQYHEGPSNELAAQWGLVAVKLPEVAANNPEFPLPDQHAHEAWLQRDQAGTRAEWRYEYVRPPAPYSSLLRRLTRIINPAGQIELENFYHLPAAGSPCSPGSAVAPGTLSQRVGDGTLSYSYGRNGLALVEPVDGTGSDLPWYDQLGLIRNRAGHVQRVRYASDFGLHLPAGEGHVIREWRTYTGLADSDCPFPGVQVYQGPEAACADPGGPGCGPNPLSARLRSDDPLLFTTVVNQNRYTGEYGYADHRPYLLQSFAAYEDGLIERSPTTFLYHDRWWNPTAFGGGNEFRLKHDSLVAQMVLARGQAYDYYDGPLPHSGRNIIRDSSGDIIGIYDVLVESWEHNHEFGASGAGGCGCGGAGGGFPTRHIDRNGNIKSYAYDPVGNLESETIQGLLVLQGEQPVITAPTRFMTYYPAPPVGQSPEDGASPRQLGQHQHYSHGTGQQRVDHFEYHSNGLLRSETIDYYFTHKTTTYEYNAANQKTSAVDPRGTVTRYWYNQRDQLIRERVEAPSAEGVRVWSQRDYYYNKKGEQVREDVLNIHSDGTIDNANPVLTTLYDYDILGYNIRIAREVGSVAVPVEKGDCGGLTTGDDWIVTALLYDGNKNPTMEIVLPRGVLATDESDVEALYQRQTRRKYDERDLLFQEIKGFGTSSQSVSEYAYTATSQVKWRREANGSREWRYEYDMFDRLVKLTDPEDNYTLYRYDFNGNKTTERRYEYRGGTGLDAVIAETKREYDALDRISKQRTAIFDPGTLPFVGESEALPSVGVEWAETIYYYNPNSSIGRVIDPNGNVTNFEYDSASRLSVSTDAAGNATQYTYDQNDNMIRLVESERFGISASDIQTFITAFEYDALNRMTKKVEGYDESTGTGLSTTTYAYDSRGNLQSMTDPQGRLTTYEYDGLSRLTKTTIWTIDPESQFLTVLLETRQEWDEYSRLIAQIDSNGNATRYAYDALDRPIVTRYADGTVHQVGTGAAWPAGAATPDLSNFLNGYDPAGNATVVTDARGVKVSTTFDKLNRATARSIDTTAAPAVAGTTWETFAYDGLSRVTAARDNDSLVTRRYDSLGRMISETSWIEPGTAPVPPGGYTVGYGYDAAGNTTLITYPSGRAIAREYDALNRVSRIEELLPTTPPSATLVAQYDYIGPSRYHKKTLGNGTTTEFAYSGAAGIANPAGDYGFKRPNTITHSGGSGAVFDRWHFRWDRAQSKTRRTHDPSFPLTAPVQGALDRRFTYDSANRLIQSEWKHSALPDQAPSGESYWKWTGYVLDGVHNRELVKVQTGDGGRAGAQIGEYGMDLGAVHFDREMNQYSDTPLDIVTYDENGNVESLAPPACGILILSLSQNPELYGASPALQAAAAQAQAAGGSVFDLARDDALSPEDVDLLLGLIEGTWTPTLRLAEIKYDYRNQMVEYLDVGKNNQLNTYAYDCFGRRIKRIVDSTSVGNDGYREYRMIYGGASGWQLLEERNQTDEVIATYIHGGYIDELVQRRFDLDGPSGPTFQPVNHYYHQDDLFNTVALTNNAGAVVERYEYGDYGAVTALNPNGSPRQLTFANDVVANRFLFTGREYDRETRLYQYRTRYLDPAWGRFTTRDTIGIWGDPMSLGNGVVYAGSTPTTAVDPLGMSALLLGRFPIISSLANPAAIAELVAWFGPRFVLSLFGLEFLAGTTSFAPIAVAAAAIPPEVEAKFEGYKANIWNILQSIPRSAWCGFLDGSRSIYGCKNQGQYSCRGMMPSPRNPTWRPPSTRACERAKYNVRINTICAAIGAVMKQSGCANYTGENARQDLQRAATCFWFWTMHCQQPRSECP